jgi:hypothetical protein
MITVRIEYGIRYRRYRRIDTHGLVYGIYGMVYGYKVYGIRYTVNGMVCGIRFVCGIAGYESVMLLFCYVV